MSSDDFYGSISSSDISRLREVLTGAGFSYADPMTDRDRDAARFVIAQHQQGARSLVDMRSALAQRALLAGILLAPSREANI
ncbi:hypothetical protein [Ciceribacter sp. T2.26MG-112.2]|uniref:hypothetical protein n=1 Tax=Ciceribacter sp. T2.26MG-112.2 TaxID=3137154 RepID=UPI0012B68380|nr:hypothetical protein [Ciceribacter naphthalenivorans]